MTGSMVNSRMHDEQNRFPQITQSMQINYSPEGKPTYWHNTEYLNEIAAAAPDVKSGLQRKARLTLIEMQELLF